MSEHPPYVDADPAPSTLLPPHVQAVAPPPAPRRAAVLARVALLKRQVVLSSVVAFAIFVGFVSGAWHGVGDWVTGQFTAPSSQQSDDGSNFFNQGSSAGSSGGSNVGASSGNGRHPVSGSGGS